jgi:hypothetical protein
MIPPVSRRLTITNRHDWPITTGHESLTPNDSFQAKYGAEPRRHAFPGRSLGTRSKKIFRQRAMKTRTVNSHWSSSIKTKIGLALVVVVTGILTLFGIYEYIDTRAALTKELNDLGDITVSRLADNLILPLWEVDSSWVSKIVN